MNRVKYPCTPHLPFSQGRSDDDIGLEKVDEAHTEDANAVLLECPRYHSVYKVSHWDAQAERYRLTLRNSQLIVSQDVQYDGGSETPLEFFQSLATARTNWPESLTWENQTREHA
jgi:hypothetical protein